MPRYAQHGVIRGEKNAYIVLPAGTTAIEYITDWTPGFAFEIESVKAYTQTAGTGAGASRTFRVLKGASTVAATATLALADTATAGQEKAFTVSASPDNKFSDTDTLTVDFAAGGTAFTAGAVNLCIVYRQLPQRKA